MQNTEFTVIHIEHDIATVNDCLKVSRWIDSCIECNKLCLLLHFKDGITVSGSFIGFLSPRVHKIKKAGGELVIVSSEPDINHLLQITGMYSIINIFSSLEAFSVAFSKADFH